MPNTPQPISASTTVPMPMLRPPMGKTAAATVSTAFDVVRLAVTFPSHGAYIAVLHAACAGGDIKGCGSEWRYQAVLLPPLSSCKQHC
jgi:hypothetical protein